MDARYYHTLIIIDELKKFIMDI